MKNTTTHWKKSFEKSPNTLRSQFSQWSIPSEIREDIGVNDGNFIKLIIKVAADYTSITRKVTSGGEFYLPKNLALKITEFARNNPKEEILFFIDQTKNDDDISFDDEINAALHLSPEKRKEILETSPRLPDIFTTTTLRYRRNAAVVAEVLHQSKGKCGSCSNDAPFLKASDSTPYLEVHHKIPLSAGGEDTVDNCIALCPNCHRKFHFG